jgi:hypothetical protein
MTMVAELSRVVIDPRVAKMIANEWPEPGAPGEATEHTRWDLPRRDRWCARFAQSLFPIWQKQPTPHPTLLTSLLRLRQFRDEDTDTSLFNIKHLSVLVTLSPVSSGFSNRARRQVQFNA